MSRFLAFLAVCLGGAVGSGARYALYIALPSKSFPVGTLVVNLFGSFLMGFVMPWSVRQGWSPLLVTALTTGLLGGFTTYSAFNFQATAFLQEGAWRTAFVYMVLTLVGCVLAGMAGYALGMQPKS